MRLSVPFPVHTGLWDLHPKNHPRRPVEGGELSRQVITLLRVDVTEKTSLII